MTAEFRWTRRHVAALIVLCLAALLDTIDVTVVNVAMPAIKDALHFSEGGLAWMVSAYMVPFGGFLLLAGRVGDMLGRRRVLLTGTVVFTIASVASGLAPNTGVMITTRAAEGLAAGFVVPMTLALLAAVFPAGPARTRAFSVWGGISAAAGTFGLILGGLLVTVAGWRWIFFINVPVGALVIALTLRVLPPDGSRKPGRFDLVGAVAVTGGASLLAYAVVRDTWRSPITIGSLVASAALLGYFVVNERFFEAHPLLPMSLLRNRSVTGANIIGALFSSAVFAMFYSTTLYMQQVLDYSALRTGLAYLPLGLSILVAAAVSPALVRMFGVRITTTLGTALGIAGLLLLARISVDGHLLTGILIPETVIGLGGGMVFVPTSIASMSGSSTARSGVASGLMNAARQLGGALGFAVISTVAASRTGVLQLRGSSASVAMTAGFHTGFIVSAALVAASSIAALTLLRETGRGERVNLIDLQTADI